MFNFFKKYLRREDEPSQRPSPLAAPSAFKQSLLSLEQRLMFDAAAAATAAEVKSEQVAQDQAEAAVSSEGAVDRTTPEQQASQELLSAMASYSPGESATEVVFVDPTVPDYQTLVAGMGPNVDVVVLDASRDGVEQIAESLAGRSGIDAIHLISHGDAGTLQLGTGTLNAESMSTRYADAFATIQQSLSEQADILVYGCNFAEGEVGQEAVARLAELTGADVEASDDLTGYASLGGDWVLEVKAGAIETRIAIDDQTQMNWVGLLGAPVLDASKSPTLTALNEDAGAPSGAVGTLVSSLVDFASPSGQVDNVTDGDAGAKLGIAITGANTSNGTWWFSTNDGATWSTLGAVSDASARLLAGDGTARIYFQANADYNGTMSDAITFHAWDQTSGINGGTGSLITTSTVLDQFTTVSYSNNDGTVKWGGSWQELGEADGTGGGMVMVNSYAGLTDNSLQIETDFLSRGASRQVDLSAVTSATLSFDYIREPGGGTKGAVSVEVYDGKTWATLQTFAIDATDGKAQSYKADISAYANANTQIRFIVSGSDSMGRLHVDNIQVAGTGTGGGATAYSTMSDTAALTVTAVNDAPISTGGSATGVEDTPVVFTWGQFNVSDVDSAMTANSAVQIQSLPVAGTLQTLVDGDWKSVVVSQIITKAAIDGGNLRYVPVSEQSGYDGYGVPGVGNQRNDYAQFSFAPLQGTSITIANPNAEADVMSEGTWRQGATGWTLHTVSGFSAGVQNLGARQFSVDQDNTFYVEQDGTYLAQTLATTFNSTNDYALSLSIGWRLDQPVSEYSVELWAGGTRLGFIDQSQVTEVQGSLVQATLQVSGAGFPALNGQALQIRLVGVVMQTNFDNLQLVSYERNTEIGAAAVMTVDITPVNDAPVLADTALSVTVTEDAGVPSGVVGSLVSAFTGGITDVDSGAAKGIAIMGSNETNGTWYYTTNGGSTWTAVGTVSDTSALLLADNGSTRLYFSPNADYNGTSTAALTVRAWDQTSGAVGTKVSTASNGGTTAFSSATDTIDVSVTPINDAPISTGGSVTGVEDTPVVFTWGQFNVSDVDSAMTANSALQIRSLPVLGSLQTLVDGDWKSVAVNQIITKATIDAGNLRYVPVSEQSGYDGYGVSGVGSQRNDYAQFSFAPVQGTPIMMNNPDAQADVIAEGTQQQSVTGWTVNTVSSYTAGVENPTSAQFSGDHDNTFFVESGGTWVGQILYTTPFNSANDYVLSLNVGCQSGLPASQYRIELWAGGTGLGSIDQTQVAEVPGSFTQVTLQVNGGAFASQDGQWFGLWMIGNSGKTYFDNIQLMSYDRNAEVGTAATMTIDITPVNDAPTDLSLSANTVAENAVNGTVVGTVNGTDPDSGDTKAYSLTDNAGGRFAINSVTGQITVANSSLLNYEVATSHNVTVRVTDSGGLTYDETFTINLTDVNEATPTITSNGGGATASISVVENTTAVTTVRATDGDTRQTLTYSISGGADATKFAINTSTGALSFVAAPNYEAPTDNGANNVYNVTVQVSDGNGGTDTQALAVTVTNVNESPTDLSLSASTVAENAANGTVVGTVTGSDVDAGDTKSYPLTNNAGGRFAINRTTGALTVANGTLLNYEAATSHSVTVRVTDRGGLTYDETFTITVTNVNEAPAGTNATVTINEDTTQTFTTANFGFSDVDAGDSFSAVRIETLPTAGTLTLSGTAVTAGQVITTADVAAGNLVFTPAANANGTGYARFTFSVRDSNNAYDPTPNTLTVNVTAVNDAPTDLSLSASTVAENAANGTVVGTVTGSDVDAGDTKSYTLTNNAGGRFAINRTTGALTVANGTLLNYEAATSHSVTVRVTDRGGLTYDETFTITVTNVNEAPAGTNATVTINEDTTQTFTTANFGFSDVDAGDSFSAVRIETLPTAGTLTLSGTAVTAGQVITTADVAAGNLVFTPAANANGTGYARFTFSVRDSNNAYDPTPNTLTVNVTAVNDAPTDLSLSASTVAENAANGTVVGTVTGSDVDAGDTKSYTLTNNAGGRFAINRTTGALTVANGTLLNYEAATSHSVTVRVTDRGGLTYDETFTITVTNVNEAPAGTNATVTINEDTTQTFTTANFGFSDVDAGDSFSAVRIETLPTAGTLTLSGTAVTAGQVITTADVAAGNLVFTPAANANGTGYARFTFSVRDSNNAYDPTPNTLTVNVTAVNDAPVVATNSGSNVAEGGVDRITSAELAVVDVDNSAAQLRFSVGTSPAHGRLELTTAPGVSATTFTQADIAANRVTYVHDGSETLSDSFTFTVSDGVGGSIGTTTVTLTIAAVNDAPTIISDGGGATASINVAENVIGITVVTGADVDIPAQALTYGISGGADQALFTINATTGALSFVAPRDFEAAADANGDNVYVVQVRVTDSQGGMATQTIAVTVTDVAERLPSAVPLLPPSLIPTAPPPVIASAPPTHELPSISVPQEDVSGVILPAKGLPIESRSLAEHAEGRPAIAAPPRDDNSRRDERPTVALAARQDEGEIRNPFTILPVEFVASDRTAGLEPTISVSEVLMTKLDELAVLLQEAIGENQKQQAMVAHVTALTGTALSVGFVAWAIRSGALLASCFATIPAWRAFDPLPVVSLSRRERTRRSQDTEATRQAEEAEFEGLHGVLGTSSVTQQPPHSSKKGAA